MSDRFSVVMHLKDCSAFVFHMILWTLVRTGIAGGVVYSSHLCLIFFFFLCLFHYIHLVVGFSLKQEVCINLMIFITLHVSLTVVSFVLGVNACECLSSIIT